MRAVTERRLFAVAIIMFALGVAAAVVTIERYEAAYDWVSHTTDVRLTIGRTISAATSHIDCGVTGSEIAEFDRMTGDNPIQQKRVPVLHGLLMTACETGNPAALLRELGEADRVERVLMEERRHELDLARLIALLAVVTTLAIAVTCVVLARASVRRAHKELAVSEERYRLMAANASDLVRILDPEWKVTYSSPSAMAILGFTAEEMQAMAPSSLNHPEEVPALREMRDRIEKSSSVHTIVHRARTKTGDYRWLETRVQPLHDGDGRLLRSYAHSRDITDRVELEGKLRELAVTDVLTGLHNRRGFELVAEPALRLAARQQRPAAVLFIDLDGLKSINDRLGHEAGDRAIKELADLMKGTLRSTDHLARLGGDELVAFAPDLDHDGAAALIERLQGAIDDRNRGGGLEFDLAASIGVALHEPRIVNSRERTLDELMGEADERMYTAKRARRRTRRPSLAS